MAVLSPIESKNLTRALVTGVSVIVIGLLITKVSMTAGAVFGLLGVLVLIARRCYMLYRISATRYACTRIADAIGPQLQNHGGSAGIYSGDVVTVRVLRETVCNPNYRHASQFASAVNRILKEEGIPTQVAPSAYDEDSDVEEEQRTPMQSSSSAYDGHSEIFKVEGNQTSTPVVPDLKL
jgi:hypothetical protein